MFKEGCRIEIFADELRRRGEENQRNAQTDSTTLSERSIIDIDNSTAENFAKEVKLWVPNSVSSCGITCVLPIPLLVSCIISLLLKTNVRNTFTM